MNTGIVTAIISGASSIITATITSLITLKINNKKNDNNALISLSDDKLFKTKQLNDLYIPFYKLYIKNVFPESNVTKMTSKTAMSFIDLFEDHVELMEHDSQELLKPLQIAYRKWISTDFSRNSSFDFGKAFLLLTDQLFEDYTNLCLDLELPLPAKANYLYKENSNND